MSQANNPRTETRKPGSIKQIARNKRGYFEYEILDEFEAGIALRGTEVKALRAGKIQLADGFAHFIKTELWLENIHIGHYAEGNQFNHEEKRSRKLLMHRKEMEKLQAKLRDQGLTLVPLSVYFKGSNVKVKIGLGKGKKSYDKRDAIKDRDVKRELRRSFSE